jgi:hypothetical protein
MVQMKRPAPHTPIMVMTDTCLGRDLTTEQLQSEALFFKPFDTEDLLAEIHSLVSTHRGTSEVPLSGLG